MTSLLEYASRYFSKMNKSLGHTIEFSVTPFSEKVLGDTTLINFLIESLINEAISYQQSGKLELSAIEDGEYNRFLFTDHRRSKTQEELNHLFYPSLGLMSNDTNLSVGTEFLICKQIIREHDEYAGRRGCRINAEQHLGGGFTIYFTLPKRMVN